MSGSFSAVASRLSGTLLSRFLAGWNNPAYRSGMYRIFAPGSGLSPRFYRAVYAPGGRTVLLRFFLLNEAGRIVARRNWTLIRASEGGDWRVSAIQ